MPSGAVFTMVRISGIDPTRPAREMQSGIRCRRTLACSCTIATQHNTSNSNRLQATGESVMRPELPENSLGYGQSLVVAKGGSHRSPEAPKFVLTYHEPGMSR